jgi:rhodanese-related sulfurtransferase
MPEISPTQAKDLIEGGAQVLDVRTPEEFEAGRVPSARYVPLSDVQAHVAELDKEKPVVLYCRSGDRSAPAADAFAASGWDAHSIEGGLARWSEEGNPLEPEGGLVAENPNMPPR